MVSNRVKLLSAALALLVALVLLASGTFAWFTLSTQTMASGLQVSMEFTGEEWPFWVSLDGVNFTKEASVQAYFTQPDNSLEAVTYLRPISTRDGINWFLPNYDSIGSVSGFRPVSLESVASCLLHKNANHVLDEESNYLVYYDMWVKTEDPNTDYYLKLTNPTNTGRVEDYETQFGTYVLSVPQKKANGGYELTQESENATCCVRIGFQCLSGTEASGYTADSRFVIFEPNADKMCAGLENVEGYNVSRDITYIAGNTENAGKTVGEYDTIEVKYPALLPYEDGGSIKLAENNYTIRQYSSYWDEEKLAALGNDFPDSTNVATFGAFVADGNGVGYNDLVPITTIRHGDDPQLIRVYIWLEGQDEDCWNEVREGSIFANLEFKGDPVN